MKISELLQEAARKAARQEIEPSDLDDLDNDDVDDLDNDDVDNDDVDDTDNDDGPDLDEFKKLAGRIGGDLYSLTAYDYSNEFSSVGPNSTVMSVLEPLSDQYDAVKNYLSVDLSTIVGDKVVSAVILNDRTGDIFGYYAGTGGALFNPGISSLIKNGAVEGDQVGALRDIEAAGKQYSSLVKRIDWDAGSEASNPRIYDHLDALTYALRLPDLPEKRSIRVPDDQLTADELKMRNDIKAKLRAKLDAAKEKQKQIEKTGGAGREKR